jgi:hypothetical protein
MCLTCVDRHSDLYNDTGDGTEDEYSMFSGQNSEDEASGIDNAEVSISSNSIISSDKGAHYVKWVSTLVRSTAPPSKRKTPTSTMSVIKQKLPPKGTGSLASTTTGRRSNRVRGSNHPTSQTNETGSTGLSMSATLFLLFFPSTSDILVS